MIQSLIVNVYKNVGKSVSVDFQCSKGMIKFNTCFGVCVFMSMLEDIIILFYFIIFLIEV